MFQQIEDLKRYGYKKTVICLSAPSGAGKSTFSQNISQNLSKHNTVAIYSTDDFFIKDGVYLFDIHKLGEAHKWNFDRFVKALENDINTIIIDNTNLSFSEFKPYMKEAFKHEYGFELLTLEPVLLVEEYLLYNKHGVPKETIIRQVEKFSKLNERINNGDFDKLGDELRFEVLAERLGKDKCEELMKKVFKT